MTPSLTVLRIHRKESKVGCKSQDRRVEGSWRCSLAKRKDAQAKGMIPEKRGGWEGKEREIRTFVADTLGLDLDRNSPGSPLNCLRHVIPYNRGRNVGIMIGGAEERKFLSQVVRIY